MQRRQVPLASKAVFPRATKLLSFKLHATMTETSIRQKGANSSSGKRNLFVRIDPENKDALKLLAKESDLTLEGYVEAVLKEAIKDKDAFKTELVKVSLAS